MTNEPSDVLPIELVDAIDLLLNDRSDETHLTRDAVIGRLCAVCGVVREHFEPSVAADCFCGQVPIGPRYLFDERVMLFIEAAVARAIESPRPIVLNPKGPMPPQRDGPVVCIPSIGE